MAFTISSNVQVTLGILAALIEKSPKDAALIAPYMLKILDVILRSNDITMIESSIPTFEAFCEHHDATSLFGDKEYLTEYESVVRQYAKFASTQSTPGNTTAATLSRPMQMRWRNVGLSAIRCVSAADALSSLTGRQIDVIVPMILENLWTSDDAEFLDILHERVRLEEKVGEEKMMRRRNSVATVRTIDTTDANPVALLGTAADVDKIAEEENGVLALQCLKSIFIVPNRSQIHAATGALLKFIAQRTSQGDSVVIEDNDGVASRGWAIKIFTIIARWAPVQDRYVILVVALDTLMRTPTKETTLEQQLVLSAMIGSLLRSDINLIGLSVMDVLLGLIRQLRKLFQLTSGTSRSGSGSGSGVGSKDLNEKEADAGVQHLKLRQRLEQCIGDLATHVYYADQIWDMITAIIVRLKPSRSPSVLASPQKDAREQADVDDSVPDLADSQATQIDSFFSYSAGRASALRIIKAIFLVANPQTKISGNIDLSRNRVPIQVWEGTHWLLRDSNGEVRKAFADALITWLDRETTKSDSFAQDSVTDNGVLAGGAKATQNFPAARRAVSSASNRERHSKFRRSNFLPLLHLAIFDNALQFVDYDSDMVLVHTLLTRLVFKLGVNSVRFGLPMVYRLQEEIQEVETPIHKVRISALCHGYFWAVSEKFDFEPSVVGRAIYNEISRRRSKGFWVDGIIVPSPSVDQIGTPGRPGPMPTWDVSELEKEALLPFDDRTSLVQCIATGYEEYIQSPPGSPTMSPSRSTSQPVLAVGGTGAGRIKDLPDDYRLDMSGEWTRESLLATIAAQGKSESINGSRSGTTGTKANRLTINTIGANGNGHLPVSPYGSLHNLRPHSAQAAVDRDRFGSMSKLRKSSVQSGVSRTPSTASKNGIASVDQLKMMLAGNISPRTAGIPGAGEDDDSGDSMVSYDYTLSELSFNPATQSEQAPSTTGEMLTKTISASSKGLAPGSQSRESSQADNLVIDEEGVPPVPPLPNLSSFTGRNAMLNSDGSLRAPKRSGSGRGDHGTKREESSKGMDLQDLLRGIDSTSGEGSLGNVSKPPY